MKKTYPLLLGLLIATGVDAGDAPKDVTCSGTEPFWSMKINEGRGVFSALGAEKDQTFQVEQGDFGGFDGFVAGAGQWIHVRMSSGEVIRLSYFQASCSDNMSDTEYQYVALVEHPNGSHLAGCCEAVTTYRITGVEGQDRLNVRNEPNANAEIIDRLPNATSGIHRSECRGDWCRIRYTKELSGWVNRRYLEVYQP